MGGFDGKGGGSSDMLYCSVILHTGSDGGTLGGVGSGVDCMVIIGTGSIGT